MDIAILTLAQGYSRNRKTDKENIRLGIQIKGMNEFLAQILQKKSSRFSVEIKRNHSIFAPGREYTISGTFPNLKNFCFFLSNEELGRAQKKIIKHMHAALLNYSKDTICFKCRSYKIDLQKKPRIMGILNVTPDSFSDGGEYFSEEKAIEHALELEAEGADIIDIGAESTRPGAKPVPAYKQLKRIKGIVRILGKKIKIPISIDTSSSVVAQHCLDLGASIINDIFSLRKDKKLGKLIARYKAGIILMHMNKNPRIMQKNPVYNDLITQIISFLAKAKEKALSYGIAEENIVLDPGIGFGKTTEHNLKIIKFLTRFKILGAPILVGTSRKSFIGNVLNVPVAEREFGTAAGVVFSVLNGASIVRVHNVKQMKQVITLTEAIKKQRV
ncbi:MAG: dihydropteroate synthase [Candidatus Omnitrophota bacterium]